MLQVKAKIINDTTKVKGASISGYYALARVHEMTDLNGYVLAESMLQSVAAVLENKAFSNPKLHSDFLMEYKKYASIKTLPLPMQCALSSTIRKLHYKFLNLPTINC